MAIVVIGGLLASTVLSLLVVPVVFTYVDDLLQRRRPMRRDSSLLDCQEADVRASLQEYLGACAISNSAGQATGWARDDIR